MFADKKNWPNWKKNVHKHKKCQHISKLFINFENVHKLKKNQKLFRNLEMSIVLENVNELKNCSQIRKPLLMNLGSNFQVFKKFPNFRKVFRNLKYVNKIS